MPILVAWVTSRPCEPARSRSPRLRRVYLWDTAVTPAGVEYCAAVLGLTGRTRDVGQVGPDLFDAMDEDDMCDGWDRP